jgi:hypothetical protein
MTMKVSFRLLVGTVAALLWAGAASAATIQCGPSAANNHMLIDDAYVSACLAHGVGNLTGNPANDLFLTGAGAGWSPAGKSDGTNPFNVTFTQVGNTGTFSFSGTFWATYDQGAIAFKFGTGDQPDEWFVYQLQPGVITGSWTFVNVHGTGGGLSHVNLYGRGAAVPEPATLTLLGLGLLALGFTRRRLA